MWSPFQLKKINPSQAKSNNKERIPLQGKKNQNNSPKVIDSLTVQNITLPLRNIISMLHAISGLINAVDEQRHEPFFQKLLNHEFGWANFVWKLLCFLKILLKWNSNSKFYNKFHLTFHDSCSHCRPKVEFIK